MSDLNKRREPPAVDAGSSDSDDESGIKGIKEIREERENLSTGGTGESVDTPTDAFGRLALGTIPSGSTLPRTPVLETRANLQSNGADTHLGARPKHSLQSTGEGDSILGKPAGKDPESDFLTLGATQAGETQRRVSSSGVAMNAAGKEPEAAAFNGAGATSRILPTNWIGVEEKRSLGPRAQPTRKSDHSDYWKDVLEGERSRQRAILERHQAPDFFGEKPVGGNGYPGKNSAVPTFLGENSVRYELGLGAPKAPMTKGTEAQARGPALGPDDVRQIFENLMNEFMKKSGLSSDVSGTQGSRPATRGREPEPSTTREASRREREHDGRSSTPVAKWKLQKFDGREENWPRFLLLVEQYALAEGVSSAELFRNRIHLFSQDAADFVALSQSQSWDELVQELTTFVVGSDSDMDLLRRIEARKQGNENVAIYITRMELLFRSLRRPLAELEKVDVVIRGLKGQIGQALSGNTEIRNMTQLRAAAQRVERLLPRVRRVFELETQESDSEAEIDVVSPRKEGRRPPNTPTRASRERERSLTPGPTGDRSRTPKEHIVCFKCDEKGHYFSQCRNKPKNIRCYKCGMPDVIRTECPNCREALN